MSSPDRLYRLIHALTPAEKGYFRRYAYRDEGRKTDAIQLFDAMARAGEYDDRAMATRFGHQRNLRRWASVKQHLYRLVLRALMASQEGKTPTDRFFTLYREIQVLMRHDLREAARDKFRQMDRLVRQYDLEALRPAMLDFEAQLGAYQRATASWPVEVVDRHRDVLDGLQRRLAYRRLYARYLQCSLLHGFTLVRSPAAREAFRELASDPLLDHPPEDGLGFHAAHGHAMVRLGVHQALGQVPLMLEAGEALLDVFDRHPEYRERYAKYYWQAMNNRLNQFLLARDWRGFDRHVLRIRREAVGLDALADPVERESFLRARVLHRMILEGNAAGMAQSLMELETDPVAFPTQPDLDDILAWHVALTRFVLQADDRVLETIQTLRQDRRFAERPLMRWRIHVLYLLLQWRRGEYRAVDAFLDTVTREARDLAAELQPGDHVLMEVLGERQPHEALDWTRVDLEVRFQRLFDEYPEEWVHDLALAVLHGWRRDRDAARSGGG